MTNFFFEYQIGKYDTVTIKKIAKNYFIKFILKMRRQSSIKIESPRYSDSSNTCPIALGRKTYREVGFENALLNFFHCHLFRKRSQNFR